MQVCLFILQSGLAPVLKVIRDSCYHVDNDRSKDYCISSWIKLERDAQEDRDSFNQNFQACSGSPSCSSDACTKVKFKRQNNELIQLCILFLHLYRC